MTEVPTGDASRNPAPPAFIQRYPGAPPEPNPALQTPPGAPYPAAPAGYAAPPYSAAAGPYPAPPYPTAPAPYPAPPYAAAPAPYPAPPYAAAPGPYPAGTAPYPYPPAYGATPDPRPKSLATLALAAAVVGVVAVLIPVINAVAGLILLAAVVLGIVALASRRQGGKGLGVAAILVAVVGGMMAWILSTIVFGLFGFADAWRDDEGFDPQPLPSSETYAPPETAEPTDGSNGTRGTIASPYRYGDIVTISDAATGGPVWEISVGTPVDLTGELAAEDLFNPTPDSGAYSAAPVTLTYVGDETIEPWLDYDWGIETTWVTPGGAPLDAEYLLLPDGYVSAFDLEAMEPGDSVTFHSIVDAPLDAAGGVRTAVGYNYDLYWMARQ